VKHPQTNGKLERWFGEYQKHRLAFSTSEVFKEWYNNRPHGSLEFEHLESVFGNSFLTGLFKGTPIRF
jgi:putative transposase